MLINNKIALSYLLKMVGKYNRGLQHISNSIWNNLFSKQIAMFVEYLHSALNVFADWESQNPKDNSKWKLDVSVFQDIVTHNEQPALNLFTSRLFHQFPQYMVQKPHPGSIETDAFMNSWDREYSFPFPPFSLISWVLRKILTEKIDHLIIVPVT